MRMVRWICGNAQKDRIWNEEICLKIGVVPINGKEKKKKRESHLKWFGHVQRRVINAMVRKSDLINVEEKKIVEIIKNDMLVKEVL